jgi:transcriptional antiterminator RfaH
MLSWYALRSKPNKEDYVWRQAVSQGIDTFYPRIRVNPINPRARKVRPYFPGYLFVRVDLEQARVTAFKWMPETAGLVMFDGRPAVVDDELIESLRRRLEVLNRAEAQPLEGLKPGDALEIRSGPLAGYEAIFDAALPGRERVRVLLMFLGRQSVPVELNAAHIKPRHSASRRTG